MPLGRRSRGFPDTGEDGSEYIQDRKCAGGSRDTGCASGRMLHVRGGPTRAADTSAVGPVLNQRRIAPPSARVPAATCVRHAPSPPIASRLRARQALAAPARPASARQVPAPGALLARGQRLGARAGVHRRGAVSGQRCGVHHLHIPVRAACGAAEQRQQKHACADQQHAHHHGRNTRSSNTSTPAHHQHHCRHHRRQQQQ